jgi:cytochrome c553
MALRRTSPLRLALAGFALAGCGWAGAQPAAPAAAASAPTPPPPPVQVPDTMAQRTVACTTCHGKEGRATNQGWFPRIAGKPAGYLANQLENFRAGRRRNATMTYLVEHLSDDYLREIAGYFSSLDLPYPPPAATSASAQALSAGEALVRQGDGGRKIAACSRCHGEALTGVQPSTPGLLGLPRDYIVAQFGNWQTGLRKAAEPDCMAKIAQALSATDVAALASWLAAQPLPADPHPAASLPQPLPTACGSVPK